MRLKLTHRTPLSYRRPGPVPGRPWYLAVRSSLWLLATQAEGQEMTTALVHDGGHAAIAVIIALAGAVGAVIAWLRR